MNSTLLSTNRQVLKHKNKQECPYNLYTNCKISSTVYSLKYIYETTVKSSNVSADRWSKKHKNIKNRRKARHRKAGDYLCVYNIYSGKLNSVKTKLNRTLAIKVYVNKYYESESELYSSNQTDQIKLWNPLLENLKRKFMNTL